MGIAALSVIAVESSALAQVWLDELKSEDLAVEDRFGSALDVSGNRVLVGARNHDHGGFISNSGAAYVFVENAGAFAQEAQLLPVDPAAEGKFGHALSMDGDTALVGAPDARQAGSPRGAAYIFELVAGSWVAGPRLSASQSNIGDRFGWSVSLDGEWAAVGAYGDDVSGFNAGSVSIFRRDSDGGWLNHSTLRAQDGEGNDFFGRAVAIEGDRMLVGAPGDDDRAQNAGAVYVFEWNGVSWDEADKVFVPGAAAHANVGEALALDGTRFVVSVPHDDTMGNDPGFVCVFELNAGAWKIAASLSPTEAGTGDEFGAALDLRGERLLVGAPRFDGISVNGGMAWLFSHVGDGWLQVKTLVAPELNSNEGSGYAVGLSDDRLFVGGHRDSSPVVLGGSVQAWSTESLPQHSAFCFGVNCPCGNDDPQGGCWNSTSQGARMSAWGSLGMSNDDLVIATTGLVPGQMAVVLRGAASDPQMFGDGLRCVGGGSASFLVPPDLAGMDGTLRRGPGMASSGVAPMVGTVVYLQTWYRDPGASPCGAGFGLSNALALEFTQ